MPIPLTASEIDDELQNLKGWEFERDDHGRDTIFCKITFNNFSEAWAFLSRIALLAEQINHHPEMWNVYNRVKIVLTTHDAGNKITDLDIQTAKRIVQLQK